MKFDEVGEAYREEFEAWVGDDYALEDTIADLINAAICAALSSYDYRDAQALTVERLGDDVPPWLAGAIHNLIISEDFLDVLLEAA